LSTNRKFQLFVTMALVAILLQSFTTHVSAVQPSDFDWSASKAAKIDCEQVIKDAAATIARIDVPSTRSEYAAMDRVAQCLDVGGVKLAVPVTGLSGRDFAPGAGYLDNDFMQFKLDQIERISQ
jgi:hypothetical protein